MGEVEELMQFLSLNTREDIRNGALEIVLGLTASESRETFFNTHTGFVDALVTLAKVSSPCIDLNFFDLPPYGITPKSRCDAFSALTNLADVESLASQMVESGILSATISRILDASEEYPDQPCLLLGNISRHEALVPSLVELKHQEKHCTGRTAVLAQNEGACIIQRLLPFTRYPDSNIRRYGIAGALRNCCFETSVHKWLLSDEVSILPSLLLPLAGPEDLNEEDMDGMLDDLQYLPPDKEREKDPSTRKLLLEALLRLGATKHGRETMRHVKVYPILREYHKWEQIEDLQELCEQVVQLLINDETGVDDLTEFEIDPQTSAMLDEVKDLIRQGKGPEVEIVSTPAAAFTNEDTATQQVESSNDSDVLLPNQNK
eukprot:gene8958-1295_t